GHLEVVNRLLEIAEVRANATAADNWALSVATRNSQLEVVNRLLEIEAVRTHAAARNNYALIWAARNGHLEVVNRLLEIAEVRANTAARNNQALRLAAENGHSEVVHALAKAQWPLGKQDMSEEMQQYLPMIMAGAQLYTAKREQERILISALQNKSVLSTNSLYAASPLEDDPRASWLFNLPGDVVDSIASYAVYEGQSLAEQIRKDDWQNAWNDMRRSERLYGLFTSTNTSSGEEQQALVVYKL
ncbi:MAG: ankyrin repeat domain-containing protein, partial [Verrucomicrobiota bacterium]|nr:ankyrin repeat domain-containing protein [Verrucomicrobiota bacterium]